MFFFVVYISPKILIRGQFYPFAHRQLILDADPITGPLEKQSVIFLTLSDD